jgi:hypothetical protein
VKYFVVGALGGENMFHRCLQQFFLDPDEVYNERGSFHDLWRPFGVLKPTLLRISLGPIVAVSLRRSNPLRNTANQSEHHYF